MKNTQELIVDDESLYSEDSNSSVEEHLNQWAEIVSAEGSEEENEEKIGQDKDEDSNMSTQSPSKSPSREQSVLNESISPNESIFPDESILIDEDASQHANEVNLIEIRPIQRSK